MRTSVTTMAPRESKILPGAAEDVLRSLQALPGVTSVNDFSSQLVVRGSGPDQNLILIDGFEVLNPYRLYGFVSMFNPETVSDISLQTGGFAAQYGDRLSAVLDVRNREGRTENWAGGKINLSLTNLNFIAGGGTPVSGPQRLLPPFVPSDVLRPHSRSLSQVGEARQGRCRPAEFPRSAGRIALPFGGSHKVIFNAFTSRDGVNWSRAWSGISRTASTSSTPRYNTLLGATWQFNSFPHHPAPDAGLLVRKQRGRPV